MPADPIPFVPVFEPPLDVIHELEGDEPIDASFLNRALTSKNALAAVVVRARVIRREMWVEKAEMAVESASALPTEVPPPPTDFIARSYRIRKPEALGVVNRCTFCDPLKVGFVACAACGRGLMGRFAADLPPDSAPWTMCAMCDHGFVVCSACDGTGETLRVDVGVINDVDISVRQVHLPSSDSPEMFQLAAALRRALEAVEPPPELATPLTPEQQGTAYRGAMRNAEPIFHGHRFEDALVVARKELQSLSRRGPIVHHEVRSYAWPFLWLTFLERPSHAAVLVRPDGKLAVFVPEQAITASPFDR